MGGIGVSSYISGANETRKYYFPPKIPQALIFKIPQAQNISTKHCCYLKTSSQPAKNARRVFDSLFKVFVLNPDCNGKKK